MRRASAVISALVVSLLWPGVAPAQVPDLENDWMGRRILNIAHQGGELEAPSNTLYAFTTALEKGADVLELDVHATFDRELVVLHDPTVDRTTDGAGRADELTLAQIKELDAAHWFVPDCGTCHGRSESDYELRGYATEDRELPEELEDFEPNDFKIPTLREVLVAFPETFINIEIKATYPDTEPYEKELADLLQEFERSNDTIVVSFLDHATERFNFYAPEVDAAAGTGQVGLFWASSQGPLPGAPNPRYEALQVPIFFELPNTGQSIEVVTEDFVRDAHANGLAVHVWTINDRPTMEWLIEIGVDGIMTDRPTLLADVLSSIDDLAVGSQPR